MPPKSKLKGEKVPSSMASVTPGNAIGKARKGDKKKDDNVKVDSRKARKAAKSDIEANRIRERDEMMKIYDSHSDEDNDTAEVMEIKHSSKYTVDKFGNTISKAKLAEDQRLEKLRSEARARRAARGIGEDTPASTSSADSTNDKSIPGGCAETDTLHIEETRRHLSDGLKLTHREKRGLTDARRRQAAQQQQEQEEAEGLSAFHLFVRGGAGEGYGNLSEGDGAPSTLSAIDIIIPSFSLSAPSRTLLADASLRIVSGKKYGLLGPNGRGKTTLLKFLAYRKLPVPAGVDVLLVQQEVVASEVSVVEQVLASDSKRTELLMEEQELRTDMEEQEQLMSLPAADTDNHGGQGSVARTGAAWTEEQWSEKLQRYAAVGEELESSGADASEGKVRRILTGLGFTTDMQDGPSTTLSGGWRMRVALACALYMEPRLLLLDEPTNHLDLNAVLWLEEYLSRRWRGSLVVVSHDADFLESVCTDIIHLDAAKLNYYSGSYSTFEGMRGQIEAKKQKDYQLQQKTLKEFKSQGLTVDKAERKTLSKLNLSEMQEPPKEYRVNFNFKPAQDREPSGVDLLDVSFSYGGPNARQLFSNVRLRVDSHSRVAIVGPNGAGKSTLLRLLLGDLLPTSGEVLRHSRLRIGRYDQHFEELLPFEKSPVAFLTEQFDITVVEARKYLGMFGLDGARHMIRIEQLSGGQKARCVFASLALLQPHLLILDEPTNHLDMESVEALIAALRLFEGGVVLVSHDARLISALECDMWVCGDTSQGLRVERRGFEKYRLDVLAEVRRQEEDVERRAARKAEERKAMRTRLLMRSREEQCHRNGGVKTIFKFSK